MRVFIATATALLMASSLAFAHDRVPLQYRIERLEGVGGTPSHINNRGAVTGYGFDTTGNAISFLWTHHRLIDLRTDPAFTVIDAQGVNDRDEVTGTAVIRDSDGTQHVQGYFWRHGHFEAIGDLPGNNNFSAALAINNRGQVVGNSDSSNGRECFIWEDGTLMPLSGFPLPADCDAMAINDFGVVTGFYGGGPFAQAFVWHEGVFKQLPIPADGVRATTSDINNYGVIVGSYTRADNTSEALVWRNGQYQVLPQPPQYLGAFPVSINDFGVMAGAAIVDLVGNRVPVIWINGRVIDVNTLVAPDDPLKACAVLAYAQSINNSGEIAVLGADRCGGLGSVYRLVPDKRDRRHR